MCFVLGAHLNLGFHDEPSNNCSRLPCWSVLFKRTCVFKHLHCRTILIVVIRVYVSMCQCGILFNSRALLSFFFSFDGVSLVSVSWKSWWTFLLLHLLNIVLVQIRSSLHSAQWCANELCTITVDNVICVFPFCVMFLFMFFFYVFLFFCWWPGAVEKRLFWPSMHFFAVVYVCLFPS